MTISFVSLRNGFAEFSHIDLEKAINFCFDYGFLLSIGMLTKTHICVCLVTEQRAINHTCVMSSRILCNQNRDFAVFTKQEPISRNCKKRHQHPSVTLLLILQNSLSRLLQLM